MQYQPTYDNYDFGEDDDKFYEIERFERILEKRQDLENLNSMLQDEDDYIYTSVLNS